MEVCSPRTYFYAGTDPIWAEFRTLKGYHEVLDYQPIYFEVLLQLLLTASKYNILWCIEILNQLLIRKIIHNA